MKRIGNENRRGTYVQRSHASAELTSRRGDVATIMDECHEIRDRINLYFEEEGRPEYVR